jgi:hypothetical protein
MPLARIITTSADDSLELSMQLRSRGYRVETVAPGQIPNLPADLEVCLEECAPEDVLTKAAVVQESEDLWVFVAPGALDERSRPMRLIPLTPQVVEIRASEHAAAVAALRSNAETATVGLPEIEKRTPVFEVQVPTVVVKKLGLEPEEDPLLCELEAQLQDAASVLAKIEEGPIPLSAPLAGSEVPAGGEVIRLPLEVHLRETTSPAELKSAATSEPKAAAVQNSSIERIKKLAVVQRVAQIPIAPERVEPKIVLYKPAPPKPKRRGPWKTYKVAFASGPRLWRTASVTVVLLVLAGLIAAVVAVRPSLPNRGNTPNPNPAIFVPSAQASAAKTAANNPAAADKLHRPSAQVPVATRRRSASDDGLIANDTVVFYDRKRPAQHQAKLPAPPSDVKRYSDAD